MSVVGYQKGPRSLKHKEPLTPVQTT